VSLTNLIRHQLAPDTTGANAAIRGPDVMVSSAQTLAIALVFHARVTDAAKCGAVSGPNGRVSVSWDRTGAVAAAILTIMWHKLSGPPIAAMVHPVWPKPHPRCHSS
jgi:two-component sensor histidine kinase